MPVTKKPSPRKAKKYSKGYIESFVTHEVWTAEEFFEKYNDQVIPDLTQKKVKNYELLQREKEY